MKPFSKTQALTGKPVVTREGRKVVILGEIPATSPCPSHSLVKYPVIGFVEGDCEAESWTSDGKYALSYKDSPSDLFMESKQVEGWIAYGPTEIQSRYGLVAFSTHAWPTEEQAIKSLSDAIGYKGLKGTVRISWEE